MQDFSEVEKPWRGQSQCGRVAPLLLMQLERKRCILIPLKELNLIVCEPNTPLDLYILMDLSDSMGAPLPYVKSVSQNISNLIFAYRISSNTLFSCSCTETLTAISCQPVLLILMTNTCWFIHVYVASQIIWSSCSYNIDLTRISIRQPSLCLASLILHATVMIQKKNQD